MKEAEVTEGGDVKVLDEGNTVPLQDVSTEGFLKEMGFDVTPMFDPCPPDLCLEQYLCPVHQ